MNSVLVVRDAIKLIEDGGCLNNALDNEIKVSCNRSASPFFTLCTPDFYNGIGDMLALTVPYNQIDIQSKLDSYGI